MLIPRYWAKAETTASADGVDYQLRSWGCSPTSQSEADVDARRRLEAWVARLRNGQHPDHLYPYGASVVREALLHELPGSRGETAAIVTRNRYGSLVLNAARALFMDVDLPPDTLLRRLLGLLRGSSRSLEEQTLEHLRYGLAASGEGFRVYRTAAGFRAICTSRQHEPGSSESEFLLRSVRADQSFVALCRIQRSFRARLTPKPWRVGQPLPGIYFPFETPEGEAAFQKWLEGYDDACSGFATCRFLEQLGPEEIHPDIQPIVELHDIATRSATDLPLA